MGEGRAPRNWMDSDTRGDVGVPWESVVPPEFLWGRLACLVGGGFGGLVLRLRLCSTHSVLVEFVCFFGLMYPVDEVCLIRKENPNNSDFRRFFSGLPRTQK